MFVVLAIALFSGLPVGFVLGGVGIAFGLLGILLDVFQLIQFFNLMPRVWGGIAANPVLVAIPMFIFMGMVLERSGIAHELLHCLQVLTRAHSRRPRHVGDAAWAPSWPRPPASSAPRSSC